MARTKLDAKKASSKGLKSIKGLKGIKKVKGETEPGHKTVSSYPKTISGTGGVKKTRKWKHKTKFLRDIRRSQTASCDKFALRKTIFGRAVRNEILEFGKPDTRITRTAMYLIQQSVEDVVHRILGDANVLCLGLTHQKTLDTRHVYAAMHVWCNAKSMTLMSDFKQANPDFKESADGQQMERDFVPANTPAYRKK